MRTIISLIGRKKITFNSERAFLAFCRLNNITVIKDHAYWDNQKYRISFDAVITERDVYSMKEETNDPYTD